MHVTVDVRGLNLEKLLRMAAQEGVLLTHARRSGPRGLCVRVPAGQLRAFEALCGRCGWQTQAIGCSAGVRLRRFLGRRPMLPLGLAAGVLLVFLSSQMVLSVQVLGAGENIAEVRRVLAQEGVRPGRRKAALSADALREQLSLRLPGLAFAGVRYAGSTLLVDCRRAQEGEQAMIAGDGMDVVAAQDGVITRISVQSGTPQVKPGQAVRAGQVLILGQERTEKGETRPIRAQGQVSARVWARGDARVRLAQTHTVETGQTRTRVTLCSPWHSRVVRDAQPFASQDTSREVQPVVGLYIPLWREIETYAQTRVYIAAREKSDAASLAQQAAEEIAKKQCPPDALILDKNVDYSMIDHEFVCAVVVLEYEAAIAARAVR